MSYSTTKPDSGPSPALDVSTIQNNFAVYADIFDNNHIALNSSNQGDHSVVKFNLVDPNMRDVTENLAAIFAMPARGPSGDDLQLFSKVRKFLPNSQNSRDANNVPTQLTLSTVNLTGPIYQSFLPGGGVLYFGTTNDITNPIILTPTPGRIIFAIAVPNGTNGSNNLPFNTSTTINTVLNDRFTINSTFNDLPPPPSYSFCWLAVGAFS